MQTHNPFKFLIIFLFILSAKAAFAFDFNNVTVEMGLSNSTTFSVIKDEKGLMWFSTKEGIDRYDGTYFKNYALYPSSQITQYGLRRNKFHVDSRDRIWVYNFSDIFIYNRAKDRFDKVYSVGSGNTIRDIFVDQELRTIYMATDKGFMAWDMDRRSIFAYPDMNYPMVSLARYSDNMLLLVSQNRIDFFDKQTSTTNTAFLPDNAHKEIAELHDISYAYVDSNKNIYIASYGRVSCLSAGSNRLKTNPALNRKIGMTTITKIVTDKEGFLFFGTPGNGLFKIDANLDLKVSYYQSSNQNAEINTNEVSDIFIDRDSRLWISGHCISYLDNRELRFKYFKNNPNDHNSLHHNSIRSFIEDNNGNLWVGTNYGISILSKDGVRWRYLNPHTFDNRVSSNKVLALTKDAHGSIIAGTAQDGLFCIDDNLSFRPVGQDASRTYKTSINALLAVGNELWSGGAGSYLSKKDLNKGTSQRFPITDVLCLIHSSGGNIWAGGHGGLHIINNLGHIKEFNARKYNIGSIFCIAEDIHGIIWLASEGQGLIRFDAAKEEFTKFTVADGLPSNLVYGIEEDLHGNLWLSTTNGISCFNIENETFKNYTLDDGLPIKEFAYGAHGKTRDNEIIFGGNNGFIIFNPKELLDFDLRTNLTVTDFRIFNKSAGIDADGSPLAKSIDETDLIKLNHDQNSITFEFSSVNLVNKSNYYRWKLDGLDQEWSPVTKVNYANYTNLKPGTYDFMIQWANTGNIAEIEKNLRRIRIEIIPPFWKTIWAYLIYIALISGLVFAAVKFHLIRLSEKQAMDKIRFFVNIVHDIRTPLSLIKSPLQLAIKRNDFSNETLEILKKANSNTIRLTRLADQLLDFEKNDPKKEPLKLSYINVEQTLDKICEDFIPLMEQRGIIFTKKHQKRETLLAVDVSKFDKIMFNLLSNAIKYNRNGGKIALTTSSTGDKVQISIADNGIGIPKEQQKQLFQTYFRAKNVVNSNETGFGIGLMITKELVDLHGGEIWFESALNKGTTFYLSFPVTVIEQSRTITEPDPSEPEREPVEKIAPNKRRAKILIAEDNDELRNLMVAHLSDRYKIIPAANGAQALKITAKTAVDVIISDIMMPVMDGSELCLEIKNNTKTNHIPVILLTALSTTEHKSEGYKIGADIYMEKPVDIDLLVNCIDNLLENRKKIKKKFTKDEFLPPAGLSQTDTDFIEQVSRLIQQNLPNSDYNVENLERELGMSHANLYRKFKKLLGLTPLEYIQHCRLNKSLELMQSGDYYINEIAYMVGFSDPKYFSQVFKKYFGKNASDFLREKKS